MFAPYIPLDPRHFDLDRHKRLSRLVQPAFSGPSASLWLDLGNVTDLAEVSVDETWLGIVWHAAYRIDITKALSRPHRGHELVLISRQGFADLCGQNLTYRQEAASLIALSRETWGLMDDSSANQK